MAIVKVVLALATRRLNVRHVQRDVWRSFAVWIVLALEFALGADIVRTVIAPT